MSFPNTNPILPFPNTNRNPTILSLCDPTVSDYLDIQTASQNLPPRNPTTHFWFRIIQHPDRSQSLRSTQHTYLRHAPNEFQLAMLRARGPGTEITMDVRESARVELAVEWDGMGSVEDEFNAGPMLGAYRSGEHPHHHTDTEVSAANALLSLSSAPNPILTNDGAATGDGAGYFNSNTFAATLTLMKLSQEDHESRETREAAEALMGLAEEDSKLEWYVPRLRVRQAGKKKGEGRGLMIFYFE